MPRDTRRVLESLTSGVHWAHRFLKRKRVSKDKGPMAYTDLALSPSTVREQDELDLIRVFKSAIPRTHGAGI